MHRRFVSLLFLAGNVAAVVAAINEPFLPHRIAWIVLAICGTSLLLSSNPELLSGLRRGFEEFLKATRGGSGGEFD